MADTNQCPNPACAVAATGWIGGARVTGLGAGWDRTTGYQATSTVSAVDLYSALADFGSSVAGQSVNLTVQWSAAGTQVPAGNLEAYLLCYNAAGTFLSFVASSLTPITSGAIVRTVLTGTAAANTQQIRVELAGAATAGGWNLTVTACRETLGADTALPYADGDTPGWSWGGTAGASVSSYTGPEAGRMLLAA